jgi:ABC-type phosphate/phosphonate transport system substrate-binding protein
VRTDRLAYASFPWYDLPEMHAATGALWRGLRERLSAYGVTGLPATLDRTRAHGTDLENACLFTQTCGLPLFTTAEGHFTVLGAPRYRAAGCSGSTHRSFVVVRERSRLHELEGLRGSRFAINEPDSNSGMNLPRRLFAPLARAGRFFSSTVVTGSHAASAELVLASGADAAAIDCVTFALLGRYRPAAVRGLRVVAETAATPTPPLVTSRSSSAELVAILRRAIADVVRDDALATTREALLLEGVDACDVSAYAVIPERAREARRLGYTELA